MHARVADVMTPDPISIEHDATLLEAGRLLRLQLGRQFGRRRFGEGHARNELGVRLGVVLQRLLHQSERTADIDDADPERR